MDTQNRPVPDPQDAKLPPELRDDLRSLFGAYVTVPPSVDEAVLAAARARFVRRRGRIRLIRWTAAVAAAAAIAVLAYVLRHPSPETRATVPTVREDIDGNGRVDILDAFVVARHIDAGGPLDRAWDMTGDGTVGQDDVDIIAMQAVRLDGETSP